MHYEPQISDGEFLQSGQHPEHLSCPDCVELFDMASENLISVPIHWNRPVQLWGGDQHRGTCADIGDDFPASGELTIK